MVFVVIFWCNSYYCVYLATHNMIEIYTVRLHFLLFFKWVFICRTEDSLPFLFCGDMWKVGADTHQLVVETKHWERPVGCTAGQSWLPPTCRLLTLLQVKTHIPLNIRKNAVVFWSLWITGAYFSTFSNSVFYHCVYNYQLKPKNRETYRRINRLYWGFAEKMTSSKTKRNCLYLKISMKIPRISLM